MNTVLPCVRNLDSELNTCFEILGKKKVYEESVQKTPLNNQINMKLRESLRYDTFIKWKSFKVHGRGVEIFEDCPKINSALYNKYGLTTSKWIMYQKMVANVVPVWSLHGRSSAQDGTHCIICDETYET